jgi:hypothetical protein
MDAFGGDIDLGQPVKVYGNDPEGEKRYSPAQWQSSEKIARIGAPVVRAPQHFVRYQATRRAHPCTKARIPERIGRTCAAYGFPSLGLSRTFTTSIARCYPRPLIATFRIRV